MIRKNIRYYFYAAIIVASGVMFNIISTNIASAAEEKNVTVAVNFSVDSKLFSSYNVDSITFKKKYIKLMQVFKTSTGSVESLINLSGEREITNENSRPQVSADNLTVSIGEVKNSPKQMTLSATFPIANELMPFSHGDTDESLSMMDKADYSYYACIYDVDSGKYSICSEKISADPGSTINNFSVNVGKDKIFNLIDNKVSSIDAANIYVAVNVALKDNTSTISPVSVVLMSDKSTETLGRTGSNAKDTIVKTALAKTESYSASSLNAVFNNVSAITTKNYKVCLQSDASICATENITGETNFIKNSGTAVSVTMNLTQEQYDASLGAIGTTDIVSTCSSEIGGLGWILCPVVNAASNAIDGAYSQIEKLLEIKNTELLMNKDNATYSTWQSMRTIANIFFVIAFLIIIYSQMTGFGITNYGVKKLLPRLIIAAILVNVSFYICQFAVDISNILGSSIRIFFENIVEKGSAANVPTAASIASSILGGTVASVLVTGAVVGAAVSIWAVLPLFGIALLASLVAVLVTLLILVARQAVIIILIVVSPIAFVAYLLPNTSTYFKKWKDMFIGLLVVYPAIGAVMGGSVFIAEVLNSAFQDNSSGDGTILASIIVASVSFIPLIAVPALLKKSLNAVPALGKFASDLSSKANANVGKQFGETYKNTDFARTRALKKKLRGDIRDERYLENVSKGEYGRAQTLSNRIRDRLGMPKSAIQGKLEKTSQRALDEMIKTSMQSIQSEMAKEKVGNPNFDKDKYLIGLAGDKTNGARSRAAMHTLAAMGRDKSLSSMVGNSNFDQAALEEAMQANFGTLSKTSTDLVMGEKIAFSNVNGAKLAGFSADTVNRYMNYLNKSLDPTAISEKAQLQFNEPTNTKSLAQLKIEETSAAEANVNSFLAAVEDIKKDNSLQTSFSSKAGIEINNALKDTKNGALHLAINNSNSSMTIADIVNQDNRIR